MTDQGATGEPVLLPAGPAQQQIMVVERMVPGSTAYHMPFALRLRGPLDLAALRRAVAAVVARQESLRTTFDVVDGEIAQVVHAALEVPVEVVELDRDPGPDGLARLLTDLAAQPFDLTRRLVRVVLVRVGPAEQVLALTVHHLIFDMWSCGILLDELSAGYNALRAGVEPDRSPLAVQYADFSVWQRERLTAQRLADLQGYWRRTMAGAPDLVELPTELRRPAVQTLHGGVVPVRMSAALSAAVSAFGGRLGATPFMTIMAAFQAVIGRLTGRTDVVVGTSVATRPERLERVIGCFQNIVPVRTSLRGTPSFADLVGRVRDATLGALEHQDLPFERLVAELAPSRDLSHPPLVQIMFVLQNAPLAVPTLDGLAATAVPVPKTGSQFDLDVQLWAAGDRFEGFVEYASDVYRPETVRRLWQHVTVLLEAAVADPDSQLCTLPILSAERIATAVVGWNETAAPAPDACLHEMVAARASSRPSACAVEYPGGRLSYAELWERASAVAARLGASGVGPDVPVGLCVGRTVDRIVGMLGILAAGGAYLPLDPEYPADRLAFMLTDARTPVLVTAAGPDVRLPDPLPATVRVEDIGSVPTGDPTTGGPVPVVRPDNLAYVMYTSGSTGRPKGIAVPHRGVANNLADLNRLGAIGPGDRVLALSSMSFDMSVYEVLGTLVAGATIVLPDPGRARDPMAWVDLINDREITVWNSAPALLDALVDAAEGAGRAVPSLRVVFLGGDWIPTGQPDRLRKLAPGVRIFALGGVTEASIHSNVFRIDAVDPAWTSIPIGRPMDNQQTFVLDNTGQVAAPGATGEWWQGGLGLARGYLNRPALTASRFVPHPYAGRFPGVPPGARLYRTGDRARYRADGVIELLGRVDDQVKIRGFRIEPGEVSAALREHPEIIDAVVTSHRSAGADVRLVGYCVPAAAPGPAATDLRAHLRRTLPDYMVPSSFLMLDRLPLSPNGKVDRRGLPDPGTRPVAEAEYVAPRGPVETLVAQLWAGVLRIERVGSSDDFFALGGHSLHAIQVTSLLHDLVAIEVPLRAVFEEPTVAGQARHLVALAAERGVDVVAAAELALKVQHLSDEEVACLLAE